MAASFDTAVPALLEQCAPAGPPRHHGADWYRDDLCDVAVRQILHLAQDDDLAEFLGQTGNQPVQLPALIGRHRRGFGIGCIVGIGWPILATVLVERNDLSLLR